MAAPIFATNDLRNMSQEILHTLIAEEVISVNQDEDGIAGQRIWKKNDFEVWAR
jgi:hypothetical protein